MVMHLRIEDIQNNLLKMKTLQEKINLVYGQWNFNIHGITEEKNNPHISQTDYRIN